MVVERGDKRETYENTKYRYWYRVRVHFEPNSAGQKLIDFTFRLESHRQVPHQHRNDAKRALRQRRKEQKKTDHERALHWRWSAKRKTTKHSTHLIQGDSLKTETFILRTITPTKDARPEEEKSAKSDKKEGAKEAKDKERKNSENGDSKGKEDGKGKEAKPKEDKKDGKEDGKGKESKSKEDKKDGKEDGKGKEAKPKEDKKDGKEKEKKDAKDSDGKDGKEGKGKEEVKDKDGKGKEPKNLDKEGAKSGKKGKTDSDVREFEICSGFYIENINDVVLLDKEGKKLKWSKVEMVDWDDRSKRIFTVTDKERYKATFKKVTLIPNELVNVRVRGSQNELAVYHAHM